MGTDSYFAKSDELRKLHEGPIGIHIDLLADRLSKEGHCRRSARANLRVVSDFSHWLARKGLELSDLDERIVEQYLRSCSRHGNLWARDRAALHRLLAILRDTGAIAPKPLQTLGLFEQLENDFSQYLTQERGLTRAAVIRQEYFLRQFLRERGAGKRSSLSNLTAADISGFVERHVRDHGPRSAQMVCWALRSFLRYLRYRGEISCDLAGCVPSIRRYRLASLPSYLDPREIKRVLAGCDRHSEVGRRNYAILLVLARLGLRANEIRSLTLDDIDWESGQLTVQGKGRREAVMPLPKAVGAAVADYLRHGRPQSNSRHVFLRHLAPHDGFTSTAAVTKIATRALRRAGIKGVAHEGAHLFRHSLATQMLRAGATLTEIGQVLRHQDHDTTRIYAKVDLGSLCELALPWPGGAQ